MARSRNIKPGFFTNEELADLAPLTRLLFIGLWTLADREGRLEDRPRRIKAELLPYDDCDVDEALTTLVRSASIQRYRVGDVAVIQIVNFGKHQKPHPNEVASVLPAAPENEPGYMRTDADGEPRLEALTTKEDSALDSNSSSNLHSHSLDSDTTTTRARATGVAIASKSEPFDALVALSDATGADIAALSASVKSKQLGKAKQLLAAGMTAESIGRCAGYLASQSWRSSPVDMFTIEKERGKWEMAGKPTHAVERANGNHAPPKTSAYRSDMQKLQTIIERGETREPIRDGEDRRHTPGLLAQN